MRLTRFDELSLVQRELFRVRLHRSVRFAVLFGIGMGLASLPDSPMSLSQPGDPVWSPLLKGAWHAFFGFVLNFFVLTRVRWFVKGDEQLRDLEEMAREEKESQVSG